MKYLLKVALIYLKYLFIFLFEFIRTAIIVSVGYLLLFGIQQIFYNLANIQLTIPMLVLIAIANITIMFLIYRNHLQFSGWFKNKSYKLSESVTKVLLYISVFFIIYPFLHIGVNITLTLI